MRHGTLGNKARLFKMTFTRVDEFCKSYKYTSGTGTQTITKTLYLYFISYKQPN